MHTPGLQLEQLFHLQFAAAVAHGHQDALRVPLQNQLLNVAITPGNAGNRGRVLTDETHDPNAQFGAIGDLRHQRPRQGPVPVNDGPLGKTGRAVEHKKQPAPGGNRDADNTHPDPQGAAAQADLGKHVVEHRQRDEGAAQDAHQAGDHLSPVGEHRGIVEIEVVHQDEEDCDHQADPPQAVFVQQINVGVGGRPCPKLHRQHKTQGDEYGLGHREQQCAGGEIGIEQTNHAVAAVTLSVSCLGCFLASFFDFPDELLPP